MGNWRAEKNRGKYVHRLVTVMLIVGICFGTVTGTVFGTTKSKQDVTRYAKEQNFVSDTGVSQRLHTFVKRVYGKGEKIKVRGVAYYDGRAYYRLSQRMQSGDTLWVQKSLMTTKKPKYTYTVSQVHRMLQLKAGTKLRVEPRSSAKSFVCRDSNVITLGQTNRWYKLFVDGKVGFIRKDSNRILVDQKMEPIPINFDNPDREDKDEIINRIVYFYSMMPELARDKLQEREMTVTFPEKFQVDWIEEGPYAGYATISGQIYLKKITNLETVFLHEAGHVLTVYLLKNRDLEKRVTEECFSERDSLPFGDYQKGDYEEYIAEAFAYYVLMPDRLQKSAPNTYDFFQDILGYQ